MQLRSGPRDEDRYRALNARERRYALFCVDFCGFILDRRPDQEDALVCAANHLTAMGYYAAGLALDRRLATLRPRDPSVLYNLACSLSLVRKTEEALAVLEHAVACGYHDADHLVRDDDLATLHDDPRFRLLVERAAALSSVVPDEDFEEPE